MKQKGLSIIILSLAAMILAVVVGLNVQEQKSSGFAPDFSWVKGELEFNPLEGGFWQIRFGKETAPYGGKFVLGNDPKLGKFKNGDLVFLKGRIATQQVSIYMAGWVYEIEEVKLLR